MPSNAERLTRQAPGARVRISGGRLASHPMNATLATMQERVVVVEQMKQPALGVRHHELIRARLLICTPQARELQPQSLQ